MRAPSHVLALCVEAVANDVGSGVNQDDWLGGSDISGGGGGGKEAASELLGA